MSSSEESDAAPKPSNREDASDSGGGPPANMQKARKATVKAKAAPAKPASKKRAPEVVVLEDESSSEPERKGGVIEDSSSEEDARDKKGATGRQPHRPASKGAKPLGKRQRLVKAKSLSSEKLSAENKGKQPMEAPSQAAAPKRTVLNAAERIRLAQEALMSQVQDEKVTIEYDSEGNEVVKLLPDEGEPSASAEDSGSLSDDSDSGGDDGSDGDGEGEAVVPARSPNFEK